jgi:hypothetical protein
MSKITLAAAVVALIAVPAFTTERAEAQPPAPYLPPGAAPPWGDTTTTTTTTTETKPVPPPAATPAAPPPTSIESADTVPIQGSTTPIPGTSTPMQGTATATQGTPTPMQGTTTPTHAVFLHGGPSGQTPVIRTLLPGESLRILATAPGGWMQVETSVGSGWAFGSYLAPAGSTVGLQHLDHPGMGDTVTNSTTTTSPR